MEPYDYESDELMRILKSQKILLLKNVVKKFEKDFSNYLGVKFAFGINSGIAARYIAISSLDVKPGDEIIIPPFTSVATANSILQNRAIPVFADINDKSFTLDPNSVKNSITDRTIAIMPIHLAGVPSEMDELLKIAAENDLYVIEDVSQSFGSKYKGKLVGSIGDIGAFSFYPSKNYNISEGGVIATNNEELAEKIRLLIQHGESEGYLYNRLGWNYKMTDVQALTARYQLKKLNASIKLRNKNAKFITEAIEDIEGIKPQFVPKYCEPAFSFWIGRIFPEILGITKKQFMASFLEGKIFQPTLLYRTKLFQEDINFAEKSLPIAEKLAEELIAFDIYPDITHEEMIENIIVIKKIILNIDQKK